MTALESKLIEPMSSVYDSILNNSPNPSTSLWKKEDAVYAISVFTNFGLSDELVALIVKYPGVVLPLNHLKNPENSTGAM